MPLINGMKMACEPCIRGHRSTKCTHANERLMVPVRKPGRPLSACPHPQNQPCGCGSVTAAIPRKQACHCGTSTPPMSSGPATPQDSQGNTDVSSPTRPAFKVQKTVSRASSSRKQSFDPSNFERMNMNSVNIIPLEQHPHPMPTPFANGYDLSPASQPFGYFPHIVNPHAHFGQLPVESASYRYQSILEGPSGLNKEHAPEHVGESALATPTTLNGNTSNREDEVRSCCAPKLSNHSHSSSSASSLSEPAEMQPGSCCSSAPTPIAKQESTSSQGTPFIPLKMLPPNEMTFNPLIPQYLPQATVFTYPATYGSFQNPLQPSAWRQGVIANSFGNQQLQAAVLPGALPFNTPVLSETLDTIHTCGCGDGCQCIGCAAHPYNDASQNYVRSAWSSMVGEGNSGDAVASGRPVVADAEAVASPAVNTPSSTTSGNGEEQNFSAADFFFVNYPFLADEGCEGDTEGCPCGDDCQCFGCTIHQNPGVP